jgi:hypothetical protein
LTVSSFFAMNFVKVKCRSAYGNVLTGFIKRIRVLNSVFFFFFIDCPASRTIVSSSIINCFLPLWYRCILQILSLKWLAPFRRCNHVCNGYCCLLLPNHDALQLIPVCCRDYEWRVLDKILFHFMFLIK